MGIEWRRVMITKHMKKMPIVILLSVLPFLLFGCKKKTPEQFSTSLLDENGTFSLWVSNQSFVVKNADISVEIDGELVVSEYFKVGTQHTFKEFKLNLNSGKHGIHAWSNKGDAELSSEFELKEGDIGVLMYWNSKKSKYGGPVPPELTFSIREELLIM